MGSETFSRWVQAFSTDYLHVSFVSLVSYFPPKKFYLVGTWKAGSLCQLIARALKPSMIRLEITSRPTPSVM